MDDRNLYGHAIDPDRRGRFKTTAAAIDAALTELLKESHPFFDALVKRWDGLFPGLPLRPGRYERNTVVLYVPNAPARFAIQSRLPAVKRAIVTLEGAPKGLGVKVEIHAR